MWKASNKKITENATGKYNSENSIYLRNMNVKKYEICTSVIVIVFKYLTEIMTVSKGKNM